MIRDVLDIGNIERISVRRAGAGGPAGIGGRRVGAGGAAAAGELNFMADVLRQFIGVAGELIAGSGLVLGQRVVAGRTVEAPLNLRCACGAAALVTGVAAARTGVSAAGTRVGICALIRR